MLPEGYELVLAEDEQDDQYSRLIGVGRGDLCHRQRDAELPANAIEVRPIESVSIPPFPSIVEDVAIQVEVLTSAIAEDTAIEAATQEQTFQIAEDIAIQADTWFQP
jgi:hypothetical protein